jgi:hypothetical protein
MLSTRAKIVCFLVMSPPLTCEPILFGSNMKIFHLLQSIKHKNIKKLYIKQILSIKACNQQKTNK